MADLADRFTIIAPDPRGVGRQILTAAEISVDGGLAA